MGEYGTHSATGEKPVTKSHRSADSTEIERLAEADLWRGKERVVARGWALGGIGESLPKRGWVSPGRGGSVVAHLPMPQEVTGSVPGQGACLGGGLVPQSRAHRGSQAMLLSHLCFSLALSLSKIKKKNFFSKQRVGGFF